jgi:hypothetical protein
MVKMLISASGDRDPNCAFAETVKKRSRMKM